MTSDHEIAGSLCLLLDTCAFTPTVAFKEATEAHNVMRAHGHKYFSILRASHRMCVLASVSELPSRLAGQLLLTGSTTSMRSFCDLTASQGNAQDPPCCVGQGTPGLLMALSSARLRLPWLLAHSPEAHQAPLSSPPEAMPSNLTSRIYAGVHGALQNTQLGVPLCC